jgi:Na+/phosphate symporter
MSASLKSNLLAGFNLEHIGDIIDKNLCELAVKKIKKRYQFSAEGAAELSAFHKRVVDCLQAAFGVFMTGNVEAAANCFAKKQSCARLNWPRLTGTWNGYVRAAPKRSKPPRFTSTS